MLSKGVRRFLMNPCVGLIPFLLYFVLNGIVGNVGNSLIFSLVFVFVIEVVFRFCLKFTRMSIIFAPSFISLGITFILWLFFHDYLKEQLFIVLPEVFVVVIIAVIRLSKSFVSFHFFKKESVIQKAFINEFFEIAAFVQYFFMLHVFIILIYKFIKDNNILTDSSDIIFYILLPIIGIMSLIIYESIKMSSIVKKLSREEWLPIVNEQGEVKGKIARSVSEKMKNKFLHPVVRVALIYDGKIYLQMRPQTDLLDPGMLDHPFEKYMLFNHEINLAVRNSIIQALGYELPFHFLLKYDFENEQTKRLIFLFLVRVKSEEELKGAEGLKGKFWSSKQIENDFGKDSKFSECFQLEYEYLKNTVLMADQFKKN